jgi:hypothetical protein
MNSWDKCKNCGGDYALHHYQTNQCPRNGVEAPLDRKQEWMTTTFELVDTRDAEIAKLRSDLADAKQDRIFADTVISAQAICIQKRDAEIAKFEQARELIAQACETWPNRDDDYYRPDHEDAMENLKIWLAAHPAEQSAMLHTIDSESNR